MPREPEASPTLVLDRLYGDLVVLELSQHLSSLRCVTAKHGLDVRNAFPEFALDLVGVEERGTIRSSGASTASHSSFARLRCFFAPPAAPSRDPHRHSGAT